MSVNRWSVSAWCLAALVVSTAPATAQYGAPKVSDPATGEKYHVEFTASFWRPSPEITIASESLGIIGTQIDFVQDLGISEQNFADLRIVLRPGRKHKFHIDWLPIEYSAETVLTKTLIFNGQAYTIGLPVTTEMKWTTWNLAYEYDFIYRDRGFLGFLVGVKYTEVEATLTSPFVAEFTRARGPIPFLGGAGRIYIFPNISITGQFAVFDMPDKVAEDWNGDMYDIDFYGTINFIDNLGVLVGYRTIDVEYFADLDAGKLSMDGWYLGAVVRF